LSLVLEWQHFCKISDREILIGRKMADEKIKNEQEAEAMENTAVEQDKTTEKEIKSKKTSSKKEDKKLKAEEKAEALETELLELKDKHIRLQAEFDNYRKRTLKEKMDLIKTGGETVLIKILPVVDDMERALTAFNEMQEDNPLKIGILLIYSKFKDFLKQNGVLEIDAKEKDFDTDLHEAVTKIPAPTEELKGKVVDVIQKGYTMNEKVIRFAKVVIGE
jgi:molecular chaperone GrpE